MPRAAKLPEDLQELVGLCREGKLFEIEEWIGAGKRYQPGPGRFTNTPLKAAIAKGFHSLVEVFLRAGISDDEKERAMEAAVEDGRLDLIQLLAKYGTNWRAVNEETVLASRNPHIVRWFVDQGFDLSGWRIAHAFIVRHRGFLGIYMGERDRIACARKQVSMALRHHAKEGDLKWVSLCIWAGADPRETVPWLNGTTVEEDNLGTALEDAVSYGKLEVIKKFRLDPKRDDVTKLLVGCCICRDSELVKLLLDAGAGPNRRVGDRTAMHTLMLNFQWSIDPTFGWKTEHVALRCLELAAAKGGRWRPERGLDMGGVRRALLRLPCYEVARWLKHLANTGALEDDVFRKLVSTPAMKQMLCESERYGFQSLRPSAATGRNGYWKKRFRRSS